MKSILSDASRQYRAFRCDLRGTTCVFHQQRGEVMRVVDRINSVICFAAMGMLLLFPVMASADVLLQSE